MTAPAWLTNLPRPALMALGDSLLNGMRSYSIDNHLAGCSIPARLGAALHDVAGFERFRPTTYPAPVLLNVEQSLRTILKTSWDAVAPIPKILDSAKAIKREIVGNARAWFERFEVPSSGDPHAFHNLALAGALAEDMFEVTLAELDARLAVMRPVIESTDDPFNWGGPWPASSRHAGTDAQGHAKSWGFVDLHMAINARHLLNPGNAKGLQAMTALDIVAARRPRALLVNLGPNHGMVDIVMRYKGSAGLDGLRAFARDWPARARLLAALPGVELVILQLMPLPTQTPCLSPPRDYLQAEPAPAAGQRYFPTYVSAFDLPPQGGEGYDSAEARRLDEGVAAVNADVRAATEAAFHGSGKTLRIVSLAEMLAPYDYKHRLGGQLKVQGTKRRYDNYPISAFNSGGRKIKGGFCGLDHIHPSALGYRFIAEQIRLALPDGFASDAIALDDGDDDFLTHPHAPSLALLDTLLPFAPAVFGGAVKIERLPDSKLLGLALGEGQHR